MSDELAKAMHDGLSGFDPAVRNPRWDELPGWVQESYRRQARAVHDYFGLPESAEKGAVGRLIDFHKRMLTGVVDADECRDILRAMGEKVAG